MKKINRNTPPQEYVDLISGSSRPQNWDEFLNHIATFIMRCVTSCYPNSRILVDILKDILRRTEIYTSIIFVVKVSLAMWLRLIITILLLTRESVRRMEPGIKIHV